MHFNKNNGALLLGLLLSLSATALAESAQRWHLHGAVDIRLAVAGGEPGLFENGAGKLRYGGDSSGTTQTQLNIAEIALLGRYEFDWAWTGHFYVKSDNEQQTVLDLVEAYFQHKPVPRSRWRFVSRIGMFFPELSMENLAPGWHSPFTITPSAINTWFGEELRTIGAESSASYQLDTGRLGLSAALLAANDPLGTLLAWRGWALHDRNIGVADRLPLPQTPPLREGGMFAAQMNGVEPFHEIDDKVGFTLAAHWQQPQRWHWRLTYYDNRGDAGHPIYHEQYAWETSFWQLGGRWQVTPTLSLLTQVLRGSTQMGPGAPVNNDFWACYLLAGKTWRQHRWSLRFDRFAVDDNDRTPLDDNNETGRAWTGAYGYRWSDRITLATEVIHTKNTRPVRETILQAAGQRQWLWQLSFRYVFL